MRTALTTSSYAPPAKRLSCWVNLNSRKSRFPYATGTFARPGTVSGDDRRRAGYGGRMGADINFYFDPVCPFAWMTSKWVRQVQAQRDYTVDWRFISLRLINAEVDYDAHFPPEYEAGHTAGLRLLRVAARARAEHGREAMAPLYAAFGAHIFDTAPDPHDYRTEGEVRERRGTREFAEPILADAGLPLELADALDAELWDHVVGLAGFPGFAELKRSLREQPQLAALGVDADAVGRQEDWHSGSRRQKK